MIGRICQFCDKPFLVKPSRANQGKYCSHLCHSRASVGKKLNRRNYRGCNNPNFGKKHTDDVKKIMSIRRRGKGGQLGEKNPMWRGGVSKLIRIDLMTSEWDKLRKDIYKRDGHLCRICGEKRKLHCHHIVPYRISQDNRAENLITLCCHCHLKEEHRYYCSLGSSRKQR